ncbi:DUF1028 domain-containing protein [Primorskyibacter sp. 2E107]|uniref:DUF1028 domain-containing protein n=1 Tax=Primorskyibacter sp. 2E107 TaxID=3403458 RepID=UPI003AF5EE83
MTYSILVRDPATGTLGGAATTGSLCVGGWVLRGRVGVGLSASQGAAPSTFWGEDVLDRMAGGAGAPSAVRAVTEADPGRAQRQLTALDGTGTAAIFTGADNTPAMGHCLLPGGIAAGNLLTSEAVLEAAAAGYETAPGGMAERLIAALRAGERAGSDSRGLMSAALLILHPEHAPMTLRVDYHDSDPIGALAALHARASSGFYAEWAAEVPCEADPTRVLSSEFLRKNKTD